MTPPPSPITEAAGLLRSGAIFTRRVGLRPANDAGAAPDILAGFKRGGFALYHGDAPICHFDLEGRWQRAFVAGTHYLKGLDATVRAVDRPRESGSMVLRRRTLAAGETAALDVAVADQARTLRAAIEANSFAFMPPPAPARSIAPADLIAMLGRIAGWDAGRWAGHQAAYRQAYGAGPPPFLPPDCPNPVVVRPRAGMSARDVADHARRGRGAPRRVGSSQCRDVFLAEPDWAAQPPDAAVAWLDAIRAVFPPPDAGADAATGDAPRLGLIHAWLEGVPDRLPPPATWGRLGAAGLGRVTLRVDGWPPRDPDATRATVTALRGAGIGVGLAVFLTPTSPAPLDGAGADLPLGPGDLVTLVAADPAAGTTAPDLGDWKARITAALPPKGPRVITYNPDKQWA